MNIVDPFDNVFAKGKKATVAKALKIVSIFPLFGTLNECLKHSKTEPNPRARVRGKGFVAPEELDSEELGLETLQPIEQI
jgi:hypothetical protein